MENEWWTKSFELCNSPSDIVEVNCWCRCRPTNWGYHQHDAPVSDPFLFGCRRISRPSVTNIPKTEMTVTSRRDKQDKKKGEKKKILSSQHHLQGKLIKKKQKHEYSKRTFGGRGCRCRYWLVRLGGDLHTSIVCEWCMFLMAVTADWRDVNVTKAHPETRHQSPTKNKKFLFLIQKFGKINKNNNNNSNKKK